MDKLYNILCSEMYGCLLMKLNLILGDFLETAVDSRKLLKNYIKWQISEVIHDNELDWLWIWFFLNYDFVWQLLFNSHGYHSRYSKVIIPLDFKQKHGLFLKFFKIPNIELEYCLKFDKIQYHLRFSEKKIYMMFLEIFHDFKFWK